MRDAKAPITIRAIFDDILKRKALSEEALDPKATQKSIGKILAKYEKDGTVKKIRH